MGCNSSKLSDGVNAQEGTNYKKTAQDITKKVNNVINRIDAQLAYDDQVQAQLTSDANAAEEKVEKTTTEAVNEAADAAADVAVKAVDDAAEAVNEAVAE